MASCEFKGGKCKSKQQAKAYLRHNDKDRREATKEHSNKDIDKSKTSLNVDLLNMSYEDKCKKYDDRISELDATTNTNKRKDRLTMQGIVVPAPLNLPRERYLEWFTRVHEILTEKYGKENCVGSDVHYDEEHKYIDPETRLEAVSRVHLHYSTIPVLNGSLNGKWCSERANMIQLNNAIQEMSQNEFGVDFMDGTKKKGSKSTETLKNASKQAEMDAREEDLEIEEFAVSQQAERNKQDAENNKALQEALEAEKEDLRQLRESFILEREKWRKTANTALETLQKQLEDSYETQVEELNRALNKAMTDYKNKLDAEYQRKEDALEAQFKVRVEAAAKRRLDAAQQEQFQEQSQSRIRRRLPGEPEF